MEFWIELIKTLAIATYLVIGFVIAFESVLCMSGSQVAKEWVRKRYKLKGFMMSTYIFFPMLLLAYLFLEVIPYYSGMTKKLVKFDIPKMLYHVFEEESDKCEKED
ncbi:MAG: hypothetical protein K0U47_10285 [Epsilonproteobacteria bacterium]|nr:hypothetical protein [Campylobacterota bacterium]